MTDEAFQGMDRRVLTEDSVTELLRSTDALDARLWMVLAGLATTAEDAFERVLVAAELFKTNASLWIVTLAAGMDCRATKEFQSMVCDSAIRWAGDALVLMSAMAEFENLDVQTRQHIGDLISERLSIPEQMRPKVLRLVSNDSPDYVEIPIV